MRNALWIVAMPLLVSAGLLAADAATVPVERIAVTITPEGIMDTTTELTAVVPADQRDKAEAAVKLAEEALRDVEAKMSSHLAETDIATFNAAPVGQEVPLLPETLAVLKSARAYYDKTEGVFDITCRPLLQLWKRAGKAKRLPTEAEIKEALALVGWDKVKLTDKGAIKLKDGASLDLGGIAKKWAVDRAADVMIQQGVSGIVNVGGDLRCFGQPRIGTKWQIGIKNPFAKDEDLIAVMAISDGAVCTSGNYERFVIIDGKRYSHIVDPRTGRTADAVPSVTVYGKTAVEAGVWATALSVLGPDYLKKLPKDTKIEAMIITGKATNYKFHYTDGFKKMLNEVPEEPLPPLTTTSAPAGEELMIK